MPDDDGGPSPAGAELPRQEQLAVERRAAADVEGQLTRRDPVGQIVGPVPRLRAAVAFHVGIGCLRVKVGLALRDEIGADLRRGACAEHDSGKKTKSRGCGHALFSWSVAHYSPPR